MFAFSLSFVRLAYCLFLCSLSSACFGGVTLSSPNTVPFSLSHAVLSLSRNERCHAGGNTFQDDARAVMARNQEAWLSLANRKSITYQANWKSITCQANRKSITYKANRDKGQTQE